MRYAFRCAQNRQEQSLVARILPKFLVNQMQIALDQPDRLASSLRGAELGGVLEGSRLELSGAALPL